MGRINHNDSKSCIICGGEFSRIDFPQCFDRMVTCGNIDCAGQRRYDRQRERYRKYMANKESILMD